MRILLLALALGGAFVASPATAAEQSEAQTSEVTVRAMLSQGDPSLRDMRLGRRTVGEIGCLVISILDILAGMGYDITPTGWIRSLVINGLIDSQGRLRWGLDRLVPVRTLRLHLRGEEAFNETQRRLADGQRVTLQLRTSRGTTHWVVADRVEGSTVHIRDPNGGRVGTLDALYGGVANIIGMSVISRQ